MILPTLIFALTHNNL